MTSSLKMVLSVHLLVPMNNEQMTALIQEKALIRPK